MKSISEYMGDIIPISLNQFFKPGKGDDVNVVMSSQNKYGCLRIKGNEADYKSALVLAADDNSGKPIMIAVEDPESASPMIFAREHLYGGDANPQRVHLAVIFNAEVCTDDTGEYRLIIASPTGKENYSVRIKYAKGEHITWDCAEILNKTF